VETTNKKKPEPSFRTIGHDFFDKLSQEGWTYIKTVVDVVREPILMLDKNLHVRAANEPFYRTFHVKREDTEGLMVYRLGNGQWDIPALRKLLEEILPKHTFFNGFQVAHDFPTIGRKVMILNARQIHFTEDGSKELFPPIILLAIEDVTEMMDIAEKLARHTNEFEAELTGRTQKLETHIKKLEKEINGLNGLKNIANIV
jgi:hypothetical protein